MFQSPPRSPSDLGDLVRHASKYNGPWPKLSVWHGSADRTVNPANADEIVKQWLDLHQLPAAPMAQGMVDGYPRQVWWNAEGETMVESYTITNMAHGTPLGLAANDERYGVEGAYLIEAGISSSYHIANFFGLTDRIHQARNVPATAPAPEQAHDVNPAFKVRAAKNRRAEQRDPPGRRAIDVNAVITRALTAAGLMK
jgi:feruloyl esterase